MMRKAVAVLALAAAAAVALGGCTNVTQMRQAYEAGDETQLARLLEIAGRVDYPYATRKQAVMALGDIGRPEATPVLLTILQGYDRRTSLKEETLIALGKIGDPDTAGPIGHLLDRSLSQPNGELRMAALTVLGQLGGDKSAEVLINALQYYDMLTVRAEQGRMRGVFSGDDRAIRAMRDSVRTPYGGAPRMSSLTGETGGPTSLFGPEMDFVPEMVDDDTPKERAMAHEALVRVGADAIPVIHRFLSSRDMTLSLKEELTGIADQIADQSTGPAEAEGS